MKQYAVFGNPIAHSKSPEIHLAFATQFGIDLHYERLLVEECKFAPHAMRFFELGLGANVTVPFKQEALTFADELSEEAKIAGAVNTLSKIGDTIKGDNTDGVGLVRDIRDNHGVSFKSKTVLIIGAGGAARGVLLPIVQENPHSIYIVNRTPAKAQDLATAFLPHGSIYPLSFETLNAVTTPFDIVINATSVSLSGEGLNLTPAIFSRDTLAYDMMYSKDPTPFMQFASESGAVALDGLGMLVEQAAKSFEIWHGVTPETQQVIRAMREVL